jgi:hypothetical protein
VVKSPYRGSEKIYRDFNGGEVFLRSPRERFVNLAYPRDLFGTKQAALRALMVRTMAR